MNIVETILRIGATIVIFVPQMYGYYLNNFVAKRVGQDMFALMGPTLLSMIICLPLFFYETFRLFIGIKNNSFSQLRIFEISLLLFSWGAYYLQFILIISNFSFKLIKINEQFYFHALSLHYVIWIYQNYFTAKKAS